MYNKTYKYNNNNFQDIENIGILERGACVSWKSWQFELEILQIWKFENAEDLGSLDNLEILKIWESWIS